jgi:hypothetical protein
MNTSVVKARFVACFLALLLPALSGCWLFFGDPIVHKPIQAFVPDRSKEESARIIEDIIRAVGARQVGKRTLFLFTGEEIQLGFTIPERHTNGHASISGHKDGSNVCVEFSAFGVSEFDDVAKAAIAQVRAQMVERFGEDRVAGAPCRGVP